MAKRLIVVLEGRHVIAPVVHLNGTNGNDLIEQLANAANGVDAAVLALKDAAPNARDYYVQDANSGDAYRQARDEHAARFEKLEDVRRELQAMLADVHDQVDARRARR